MITFSATINSGWHMYSTNVVPDGPTPTTINIEKISGAKLEGPLTPAQNPIKKYEDMFGTDVYFFENTASFSQKVKLLGGKYEIEGYLEYGACNDENCIPPTAVDFKFDGDAPMPKAQEKMDNANAGVKTEKVQESSVDGKQEGEADEVADTASVDTAAADDGEANAKPA